MQVLLLLRALSLAEWKVRRHEKHLGQGHDIIKPWVLNTETTTPRPCILWPIIFSQRTGLTGSLSRRSATVTQMGMEVPSWAKSGGCFARWPS